jgi:anti-sigma regulatory factor (Ser/Thr protein kinase)
MTIPRMEIAASAAGESALHIQRTEPNLWWLAFGAVAGAIDAEAAAGALPSRVLQARPDATAVTLAKLELDACGAWITLANADAVRPVVVRRAGWVDVRGHPFDVRQPLGDDRVGLGPGDALVFARPGDDDTTNDAFLDDVLVGGDVVALRDAAVRACHSPDAAVAVVGVPGDVGADPRQSVADAIGVDVRDLDLPGYPLGDQQPELWAAPPRPPRLARLRLRPDAKSVREVRELLDRLIASWRLTDRLDDEGLKLAASELATNALVHAGDPETATVRFFGQGVRIEVDDGSSAVPRMAPFSGDQPGGRGLRVVDSIASSWGVESRPSGKRVWCEINLR